MPKATLSFTLPEEDVEFRDAIFGWRYKMALWELDQWLRSQAKYANVLDVPVDLARAKIREELDGLTLED